MRRIRIDHMYVTHKDPSIDIEMIVMKPMYSDINRPNWIDSHLVGFL